MLATFIVAVAFGLMIVIIEAARVKECPICGDESENYDWPCPYCGRDKI